MSKKLNVTVSWDVKTDEGKPFVTGSNTWHEMSQTDFADIQEMVMGSDVVAKLVAKGKAKAKGR